jgi:hemerythrin-like domain-containing protein
MFVRGSGPLGRVQRARCALIVSPLPAAHRLSRAPAGGCVIQENTMVANWDEELGRRMQEEHKSLHQLTQMLKEHIASTPTSESAKWLDGLRAGFDRLYAHVKKTIQMKEQDGYLETILRERPTLAKQVASIKAENGQLLRMAEAIRVELSDSTPQDRLLVADACARIQRYMAVVGQHEQRENMIVLFAFNQELGSD